MVALLSRSPDALLPLGIDRLLTVFVGVMMALVVGWLFTYKRAEQSLINQMRRETIISLENVAQHLATIARERWNQIWNHSPPAPHKLVKGIKIPTWNHDDVGVAVWHNFQK